MNEVSGQFSSALRGYNRAEVDARVGALAQQVDALQAHLASLQTAYQRSTSDSEEQRALIADLQAQIAELGATGYTGLGLRVEKSLKVAEDHAQNLMAQADIDAERLRRSTEAETKRLLDQAQARADELVTSATEQAETLLGGAREEAERLSAEVRRESERVLREAKEASELLQSGSVRDSTAALETARSEAAALLDGKPMLVSLDQELDIQETLLRASLML